jgi:hypothetical protein
LEEDRLEHLQIAKSRGKGAPKKKRTAAGETGKYPQLAPVAAERIVILTGLTHREQEVQQQEEKIVVLRDGLRSAFAGRSFWDMVLGCWNCTTTISPHEYPSWERRLLLFACISHGVPHTPTSPSQRRRTAAPRFSWD